MKPGRLRSIIVYEQKTLSTDDYGGPVEEWEEYKTVRATVTPLRGKDIVESQGVFSEAQVRFFHRYVEGINSAMRIIYNGKAYEITGPPVDIRNMHREHEVMARAIVGGA